MSVFCYAVTEGLSSSRYVASFVSKLPRVGEAKIPSVDAIPIVFEAFDTGRPDSKSLRDNGEGMT